MGPPGEEERVQAEGTACANAWREEGGPARWATATEGRWVGPVGCQLAILQDRDVSWGHGEPTVKGLSPRSDTI